MAKQTGGDADPKDDNHENDEPADDKEGKGGKPGKGKADKTADDPNEKKFTQADVDAALAQDRLDRKKATPAKANSTSKKKETAEDDDGETEKERRRADEAEQRLRTREARDTVEDAARAAGFTSPNKIFRLIKDDLTFDDSGKPDNVKDLITLAKRDFKEELGGDKKPPGSADGGAKGGAGVKSSMNDFIRRSAGIS